MRNENTKKLLKGKFGKLILETMHSPGGPRSQILETICD